MYATLDDQGKISTSEFEGDWHETENDYFVLVYYKGFEIEIIVGLFLRAGLSN